jgi:hypothetical protein
VDSKKCTSSRITPRQCLVSGFLGLSTAMFAIGVASAADLRADALLQIDINRSAVVDKIVTTWSGEMRTSEHATFHAGLSGLRADRLLAASLAGTYEGALEAMVGQVTYSDGRKISPLSFSKVNPVVGSARSFQVAGAQFIQAANSAQGDQSKAAGDNLVYNPVTPCRIYDTRVGQVSALDSLGKTPMTQQTSRTLLAGGKCGIPATGVKSIFFSFHAYTYNPAVLGVITFQQTGAPVTGLAGTWTGTPWAVGTVISQTLDNGSFDVFVGNGQAMSAEMVIDVQGYFSALPAGSATGLNVTQSTVNNQTYSTVVLGSTFNTASGLGASVLGGGRPTSDCIDPVTKAGTYPCINSVTGDFSTVVGGLANVVNASTASIFGGQSNLVTSPSGAILGGQQNIVGNNNATIVGGNSNKANGFDSVVVGGFNNTVSGTRAVALGGQDNFAAGNGSFAGGTRAFTKLSAAAGAAAHNGAFVWADSKAGDFFSQQADQFAVRSTGGVRFVTGVAADNVTVTGSCSVPAGGATSWTCTSDRAMKESFSTINPKDILSKVVALPLSTWQYKGVSRRHLYPMAQDFWAAFGLGVDDKSIGSGDVGGVALAAVQGVNQKLNEEVSALKNQNAKLQKELAIIKKKLGL